MSIRWRILGAFILVIIFTILLSTGVEYSQRDKRLSNFSLKLRSDDLAAFLSRTYTIDKNWDNLDSVLQETGFLTDRKMVDTEDEWSDKKRALVFGVVIEDVEGNIIRDSLSDLNSEEEIDVVEGEPSEIVDFDTGQVVGTVTIQISREFIKEETRDFLIASLYPTVIGGLLTMLLALLLGFWLSHQITSPVTALTEATKTIVQSGETQLLPVNSSDELGQMSESFNQMITSLQTQRNLRKRLIDDLSHELNTPLSVIQLESKGLRDEIQPPADAAEHIIHEVEHLHNLVSDLNWIVETDSGDLKFQFEEYSLVKLLRTEVERWQLKAKAAKINLTLLPLPVDLPNTQIDIARMNQAMGNLIENALQHTPAGGAVKVHCETNVGEVLVSVSDTGSGISAEDLPFVFERFYRADKSRQREVGGRGLGLSIVKQIVEAHGGQVWAKSKTGKGSSFYFRLPARK
ncbi:MAG: HAMP domain-containing histidine kinase [Deltaproteobacteria bacterium]|nr:HAMP domain-containing histidine kinase [Deltaproteobacteria bacterium]